MQDKLNELREEVQEDDDVELEDLEDQPTRDAEAKYNAVKFLADLVEKDNTSFVQQAQFYQGLANVQD